jgi:proteasome lid subunit RPN8/RPN11
MKKTLTGILAAAALIGGCAIVRHTPPSHVTLRPQVMNNMRYMHDIITKTVGHEYLLCLHGHRVGDTLVVSRTELPFVARSSRDSFEGACRQSESYVGIVHSHVYGACEHSDLDNNFFNNHKGTKLSIVHCDDNLRIYTKE